MSVPSDNGAGLRSSLLAVALVAVVVTAGCSSVPGMGGNGGGGAGPALDTVPEGSTAVFHADVNGALNDDSMRTALNGTVTMAAGPADVGGTTSLDDMLREIENNTGLDMTAMHGVTAFSKSAAAVSGPTTTEYSAAVLATDWSEDEFIGALRQNTDADVSASEYAGQTVYTAPAEESWVGVIGDGRFVVGSERAVKDAMDVSAGDASAFDNDVRSAFESTSEGHLRYAASVPQDELNASDVDTQYSTAVFDQVSTVSGSLTTVSGGNLSMTATMAFESRSAATDAQEVIDGAIALSRESSNDSITERLLSANRLSVTLDGTEVTVTATNEPGTYVTLFRTFFLLGGVSTPV